MIVSGIISIFLLDIVKVQIFVADINDNAPYFDEKRYEGRVSENVDVNQDIITIKAHDLDRCEFV